MKNNYDTMLEAARQRFTGYDLRKLVAPGVTDEGEFLATRFLDQRVLIRKSDGQITLDGRFAGFSEGLSIYDWLCDRKPGASAAEEFCTVTSLPGVLVSGSGLSMVPQKLTNAIHQNPEAFSRACSQMGGIAVDIGDLGYRIELFPGLPMCLKFYFGDEEFPPSLTLLWDKNILQFVRYETVYYIAGCLQVRLLQLI